MTTYAEYLVASAAPPLVLYTLDTAPGSYADPVVDVSGNGYDGTWFDDGSIGNSIYSHAAIYGNGAGSLETNNTWVTVDHDLPAHSSWTLSFLTLGVDAVGAFRGQDLAGRPWLGVVYPQWLVKFGDTRVGTVSGTLRPVLANSGAVTYRLPEGTGRMTGLNQYVCAVRYDSATNTLSSFIDMTVEVSGSPSFTPSAFTAAQRLRVATSTLYNATSHWAYWDSALTDEQIIDFADVAINGAPEPPVPDETIKVQPVNVVTNISGSVTLQTRIDVDGGPP